MSNRNFILLTIILVVIAAVFFLFLFLRDTTAPGGEPTEGTNFFSQFNPFGGGDSRPGGNDEPIDLPGEEPTSSDEQMSLVRVSSVPVAGYAVFMKERYKELPPPAPAPEEAGAATIPSPAATKPVPPAVELVPALRYVDRVNGNIYQTFADVIEERKFSRTEIPKVYEAFFGNKALSVIMRYLKPDNTTIETFLGQLPAEVLGGDAGEVEVRGTLLPTDITDLSVSPTGASVFYLFDSGETTIGITHDFATGKRTQVFDSAFNEWLSQWVNDKLITLTTKPSYVADGYMYALDPGAKSLSQVLSSIKGLTTLTSPDGKKILYTDNNLALSLYDRETNTASSLGIRTLPEKCVWGKGSEVAYCLTPKLVVGSNFPDSWYQGEISFDDQIWKVLPIEGSASILVDPAAVGRAENVDGIKLTLDPDENYLFFMNKKDSFLWKLRLR